MSASEQLISDLRLLGQSSAHVGAGQINKICQTAVNASPQQIDSVLPDLYVLLIEASIEFKMFVHEYIQKIKGTSAARVGDDGANQVRTALAEGYSVKYDPATKKYFCLKAKQCLEARLMIFHHAGNKAQLDRIIKRLDNQQDPNGQMDKAEDYASQESVDLNPFSEVIITSRNEFRTERER